MTESQIDYTTFTRDELEEAVCNAKSDEAMDINFNSRDAQIEYLTSLIMPPLGEKSIPEVSIEGLEGCLGEKSIPEVSTEVLETVNDLCAERGNGACPNEECSGGIVDGICSQCEDEWAYKIVENS